jgi:hypothetical protein
MARAKTNEFELYANFTATTTATNLVLDLSDYVDIADNEAFKMMEWEIGLEPSSAWPENGTLADGIELNCQLADTNIGAFVSHADRTSIGVNRQTWNGGTGITFAHTEQHDLSSGPDNAPTLIVSKNLWLRIQTNNGTDEYYIRMRGKIVKPTKDDFMALILTQTGSVA